MESFGERLQREREMRGVTLEEIAEATKIGTRSLRALEEQDFDKLPGGIFNKGFVRAYARYLGLDEEQAVADYLAALSEAQAAGKVTRQDPNANLSAPEREIHMNIADDSEPLHLPLGLIAVVVILALALFGGWKYVAKNGWPKLRHVRAANQPQAQRTTAAAPSSGRVGENALPAPSTAAAAPTPAAAPANQSSAVAVAPARQDEFVVGVRAREDSWVSIVADGKAVTSGIVPLGTEKLVHAQHSVVLKTGNAGGIELFHNGNPVPFAGGEGQTKTIEFTAAGVRQ